MTKKLTTTATPSSAPLRKTRSRKRFEHKRDQILDAATDLINDRGIKGMTFLELATMVNLNTTSVTYYFRKKEDLAAAVFEQTLDRLEAMAIEASAESTPQERVRNFVRQHVALHARVLQDRARPLANLSDLRTLDASIREPLQRHYQAIFRRVRNFFDTGPNEHRTLLTAKAHILLEVIFWLPAWIRQYGLVDLPRVNEHLYDLLAQGIALPGSVWRPKILRDLDEAEDASGNAADNFLHVATRLINESGYRGASVDRIVSELKVTKGSFYHHLEAKDDLILECFRQSYRRVSKAQSLADAAGGDCWQRLSSTIATLLNSQFESEWPLLRTTALQALPQHLRIDVVARSNRMALRFAGTLVDGMCEGSLRIIDPAVASQLIMATLNAAYELRKWASVQQREHAIFLYAKTLAWGLFDDRLSTD